MLAAQDKNKTSMFAWIAFLAAATMVLILTSSTINYPPSNAAGSLLDQIAGVLPYALIAAVAAYYLSGSRLKEELSNRIKKPPWVFIVQCLVVAVVMLAAVLLLPFFPQISSSGQSEIQTRLTSGGENNPNLPEFNLLSLLTIFMIAFPIAALLLATYLRKKTEGIEEPVEEETGPKEGWKGAPENTYDETRRTVIANYVSGRELMAQRGVPSNDTTTSREFESNVVKSVNEARKDFVPLTRLFEEARFSIHSMGESEGKKAEKHRKKLEDLSSEERGK
jgi:hypothetical protein